MGISNRDRVGRSMDLLKDGLAPYVARELTAALGPDWLTQMQAAFAGTATQLRMGNPDQMDCQALLVLMRDHWNDVFGRKLGRFERNLIFELIETRNRWAHQHPFNLDDTLRALDSINRILQTIAAAEEAAAVDRERHELLRLRFEEQSRRETRQAAAAPTEGRPASGLRPWREVATPHVDVASGRYQQAEFAADLSQVHRGEGAAEYRDPTEFFRRTYLTEGLTQLLLGALRRLTGTGGDPVVELQTNFGGGKTHAMLALFHLFSGVAAVDLPGIERILQTAGVSQPPEAARAVLVGQALNPTEPRQKPDGTLTRTLWGELAWQIGKAPGYALVAAADERGVNPGSDVLRELFRRFGPCLILIDEWAAFARNLYGVDGLPAGSFDANLSFVQSLTEAARASEDTLLVAAIPYSDIEKGGPIGEITVDRFRNVLGRVEAVWRPANAEEGFEIVRRRLFRDIDPQMYPARDAVAHAFADLYRSQSSEFPAACREVEYERRLRAAYPIHPELFDRLYTDWGTLDRFQHTRGVLRLMASVIHTLWERQDGNLLILPGSIPLDDPKIQHELTRYLEDNWVPVLATDVDGPGSRPLALDLANPNLGRYSACRRVARTLFLGSAPTLRAGRRGVDDRTIKVGCAQPGESVATFGDALRRLTDEATHLYVDGGRYWFSTQPSVARLAQDRASQFSEDEVAEEIRRRARGEASRRDNRDDFARVHVCPSSGGDVPDEMETRLIILDPGQPHIARANDSLARRAAETILEQRGNGRRAYANALIFLAPDRTRLGELQQAVRSYLAWASIETEAKNETLNLDTFQQKQTESKRKDADETVRRRVLETYIWLLAPYQEDPQEEKHEWQEFRLQGDEGLAARAGRKLRGEGLLITSYAPTLLRREMDRIPLWRGDYVSVRQLWDDFARYLYLPRLRDGQVLAASIQDGVSRLTWESECFAYAEGWDEAHGRYLGLQTGTAGGVSLDGGALVVRPEAARRQIDAAKPQPTESVTPDRKRETPTAPTTLAATPRLWSVQNRVDDYVPADETPTVTEQPRLTRYHGTVEISPLRMSGDAGRIAQEIVQHLAALPGARVRITLEIEASIPDGAPDNVIRTVTENGRTLRFTNSGFEEQ